MRSESMRFIPFSSRSELRRGYIKALIRCDRETARAESHFIFPEGNRAFYGFHPMNEQVFTEAVGRLPDAAELRKKRLKVSPCP